MTKNNPYFHSIDPIRNKLKANLHQLEELQSISHDITLYVVKKDESILKSWGNKLKRKREKRTQETTQRLKRKALEYYGKGLNHREIAYMINVPATTVQYWVY